MAIAFSNKGSATNTVGTIPVTVTINAGDTVVVAILVRASAPRTVSMVDSGGNTYTQKANKALSNASQTFLWSSFNVGSSATSVTVTVSGLYIATEVVVATYTGVQQLGTTTQSTATSTTPQVTLLTQDANNFVVANLTQETVSLSESFSANTGNLRQQQASTDTFSIAAINDNTAATATNVVNKVTSTRNAQWNCLALELRTQAPVTGIPQLMMIGMGN